MQTLTEIRRLLDERGLRPKHRLGQNFLHDKNQLVKLLDSAEVNSGELILEVGPGTGTLTSALLGRGAEVIACEIDEAMAEIVVDVFAAAMVPRENAPPGRGGSLHLVRGDVLEKDRRLNAELVQAIAGRNFKLVANLPYQIASPLISTLLADHPNCIGQFVTIQNEVADRLLAKPSTKNYGALTVIVQASAEIRKISTLTPSCFWPPPEVTSAMVSILRRAQAGSALNSRVFSRFVVGLFMKRRKQLGTILGRSGHEWPADITADLRPEALTVQQFIELWRVIEQRSEDTPTNQPHP